MEKTLKNFEIINAINALYRLFELELPSKVNWAFMKNFKKLNSSYGDYDEVRKKLIADCVQKNDEGEPIEINKKFKFIEGKENIFNEKVAELLNLEDTIDIHVIKLSELDGVKIKGNLLSLIEFMIDDTE